MQAACQKCRAELKFESKSGYKRLDLYHINGNRRLPGSPWMSIPLTNALGVTSGKQHTITRAKHTFLVGGWYTREKGVVYKREEGEVYKREEGREKGEVYKIEEGREREGREEDRVILVERTERQREG